VTSVVLLILFDWNEKTISFCVILYHSCFYSRSIFPLLVNFLLSPGSLCAGLSANLVLIFPSVVSRARAQNSAWFSSLPDSICFPQLPLPPGKIFFSARVFSRCC
jgi:hypothetical protein